jgi:hypothetical protein
VGTAYFHPCRFAARRRVVSGDGLALAQNGPGTAILLEILR